MKRFSLLFAAFLPTLHAEIALVPIARFGDGTKGGAEIVAFDPKTRHAFSTNSASNTVDITSLANPLTPRLVGRIDLSPYGAGPNSVAVHPYGSVAVAVEAADKQADGQVVLFDPQGAFQRAFTVGALPDGLAVSPDGRHVVVANEGEPNAEYTVDPEGTISVIDLREGTVATADFRAWNGKEAELAAQHIRIFGPGASVAQDIEPEYVTISADSRRAWVSLQENNAIAEVDLASATVTRLIPLGFQDHSLPENALDASDEDGGIRIRPWPVRGLFMPDTIANITLDGVTYLLTANEGDARDYKGFSEEARIGKAQLDPRAGFPKNLQDKTNLGQLKFTTCPPDGYRDEGGQRIFSTLYTYGSRSFSILAPDGRRVFDSGGEFERVTARLHPGSFNGSGTPGNSDSRSDDKGPEPEALEVGKVGERTYAFIGLERIGGIMVYDITQPAAARFVAYAKDLDFADGGGRNTRDDIAPECIHFIPAEESPNGKPLLLVANEVSGGVTVYEVR